MSQGTLVKGALRCLAIVLLLLPLPCFLSCHRSGNIVALSLHTLQSLPF